MIRRNSEASTFAFEVKETDLLGRIGLVTVNGRQFETPCLLPVIHPVKQLISPQEMFDLGFGCLMTNSFILYHRRREEAIQQGVHRLLGFSGAMMTDSGGYQVLEYGSADISPLEIAEFQTQIGSDLAVPLDKPTGSVGSKAYARETVITSLRSAELAIKGFGSGSTVWLGPVQGGVFKDLVRLCTKKLVSLGFKALALGSPTEIMQNYEFSTLVDMIWSARSAMPASILFHLFGAGHPLTIPITIALGCDTFDSASYVLFARQGRYMTETGITELRKMAYLPCSCHFCNSTSPHELLSMPREEAIRRVAFHNLLLLRKEVLGTKQAIYEGRLWDLVEQRAAAHPSLYKALTSFLRLAKFLGEGTALFKEKGIMLRGTHDNQRPEFALARQHLKEVSYKSASAAALLVSGKLKPLKKLPEYSKLAKLTKATQVDVYRIHPTLGVYPAELEFSFPFTQTVAAKKELGSKALRRALSELRKKGYRKTIILKAARRKND